MARNHFTIEDKDGSRKAKLGDKRIEISVLARPNASGTLPEYVGPYLGLALPSLLIDGKPGNGRVIRSETEPNRDDESQAVWSGFVQKNTKMLTGVDAIMLKGNAHELLDDSIFNLNITYKADFSDLSDTEIAGVAYFKPTFETYREVFTELFDYFKGKEVLGGVKNVSRYSLYIAAGPEHLPMDLPGCPKNVLVGVFVRREQVADWTDA